MNPINYFCRIITTKEDVISTLSQNFENIINFNTDVTSTLISYLFKKNLPFFIFLSIESSIYFTQRNILPWNMTE